jgi:mono/diheme cytochrome c family protein
MISLRILPILTAVFCTSLYAKPTGEELYTLYCSACHGVDGKGATGGAFPPLAGSPWVHGNPKRAVAIVIYGIHGPIDVNGKAYNLEMPPQGAALSDDQITSILNYVNTAWGNKGETFNRDLIRVTRSEFASRDKPWTAPELLKLFPLPEKQTALSDVISRVYKGQWNQIPDFDKIQSENIEEEHDGILDPAIAALNEHYGIVWEGNFEVPETGEYEFALDSDDGSRITLDGKVVAEVNGAGPMDGSRAKSGKISLKQGSVKFRADFFQNSGPHGLSLKWKKSDSKQWNWLTKPSETDKPKKLGTPSIPLTPSSDKTVIYRNFIEGTTPRGIGFGFPGGMNLVYSADNLAPEIVWSGDFMDAGRHWTNRGQGNQAPSGTSAIKLTNKRFLPEEAKFKGYSLDTNGNPTFKIAIGSATLTDSWKTNDKGLVRTLSLKGGSKLEIPLGNAEITGAESATVDPGKPTVINYTLK